jgi:kynurenine formamidase
MGKTIPAKRQARVQGWIIQPGASNIVDLSYPIKPDGMSLLSIYPPLIIRNESPGRHGMKTFPPTVDPSTGYPVKGFYARVIYQMMEGHGTHVEASSHGFGERGKNIDDYDLSRFIAPAVVLNIVEKTALEPDYTITMKDIKAWEARNGMIPIGAAVVLCSGRGKYWGDDKAYMGRDEQGEDHYPGFSVEVAAFLVKNRGISMLGTDLPVVDGPVVRKKYRSNRPTAAAERCHYHRIFGKYREIARIGCINHRCANQFCGRRAGNRTYPGGTASIEKDLNGVSYCGKTRFFGNTNNRLHTGYRRPLLHKVTR